MDMENNQLQMKGVYEALGAGPYSPQAMGDQLIEAVRQHAAGRSQHDDITLVCLGRSPAD
jgi:serine phosphatase RsbU (regulator of sigma subunit)